jgi:hypothetical protein
MFDKGDIPKRKLQALLNSVGTSELKRYLAEDGIDGDDLCG